MNETIWNYYYWQNGENLPIQPSQVELSIGSPMDVL
jgi:hypothetical protein